MANLNAEILVIDTSQPGAEELLLEYSRHEEMLVRSNALEMLWDFESDAVIERMAEVLDDDEDDDLVIVEALEWVGINEMKRFYPRVVELLDDTSQLIRSFAALALIDIGSKADVAMLEEKLSKSIDDDKPSLLLALIHLGDMTLYVDDYLALLKNDYFMIRRSIAANASGLAEMVDPQLITAKLEEALEVETQAGNVHEFRDALKEIAEQS